MSKTEDPQVAALLRAREVYQEQENPDALAAVNKRLAALGHKDQSRSSTPRERTGREAAQSTTASEPAKKAVAKKSTASKS